MSRIQDSKRIMIIIYFLYSTIITQFNLQGSDNLSHMDGSSEGSGQTIAFHFKQILLKNALEYLIINYDIPIAYQDDKIKDVIISAKCDKCTIKDAFKEILKDTDFTWKKVGNQYIISLQKEKMMSNKTGTNIIRGFIRDEANNETLPYANIYLENISLGAMSNEDGYYVISNIPDGRYKIKAMMMGYEEKEKDITLSGKSIITIDFNLKEQIIQGEKRLEVMDNEGVVIHINEEIKDHRVLSAIIEFKIQDQKLPQILEVIREVDKEIDTVFSVGIVSRIKDNNTDVIVNRISKLGFQVRPNAKINIGLGRP